MNSHANVVVLETAEEVANAAAERFVEYSALSIQEHGRFAVALAGGTTPRRAYELLSSDHFRQRVDWWHVHLFFGDERMVSADSDQSNYRMVRAALISRAALPNENVHPIAGDIPAAQSASAYEAELKEFFGAGQLPRFDLIWLGMGVDGHTASLFPGGNGSTGNQDWIVATVHPDSGQARVSLSLKVINCAARIDFLVTGKEKAATLAKVLRDADQKELPAQKVAPVNGLLEWLVDRNAASLL
jgi:6-phosphogluconolactonase